MRQFEVWWADLPLPRGPRPVLLLSRDGAYRSLTEVLVVEITTVIRTIPQELSLGRAEGLPRPSVASFDSVVSIKPASLLRRLGGLRARRIVEAKTALGHALGWIELTRLA